MWTVIILAVAGWSIYRLYQWQQELLKKLYLTNTVVTPAEKEEISKCTGLTVHADQHTLPILVYKQKEHYEERRNKIHTTFTLLYIGVCLLAGSLIIKVNYNSFFSSPAQKTVVSKKQIQKEIREAKKAKEHYEDELKKANSKIEALDKKLEYFDAQFLFE